MSREPTITPSRRDRRAVGLVVEGELRQSGEEEREGDADEHSEHEEGPDRCDQLRTHR